jgi:sulfatase maturation enzyme AslB (radical SAM superfamily)
MKYITGIKCIVPFTRLMVHHHGFCYPCCPSWTKIGNAGRLTTGNSIMDIWNNERMQYIRKAILEDKLWKVCSFKYCPHAIKNEYLNLEALKNNDPHLHQIIDQIAAGRIIMDTPPHTLQIANSGKCNLKCIMCQQHDNIIKNDHLLNERLFSKIITEILPDISILSMAESGEVLFNPYSRKFLQSLSSASYPLLKIELFTNGTLFTPKLWESIRHNRYDSIIVSIDAASKDTYEKIRRNGNWDILRRNLEFISELRRQNVFQSFSINFIVMKSNYQEMKAFVELGHALGCDKIVFQKINGYASISENINLTQNRKIFAEIAGIMTDPIFNSPDVDTTVIDDYRKYTGKEVFFPDIFNSKLRGWLFYLPAKAVFSLSKYFSFLPYVYEFFKKKRIPVEN